MAKHHSFGKKLNLKCSNWMNSSGILNNINLIRFDQSYVYGFAFTWTIFKRFGWRILIAICIRLFRVNSDFAWKILQQGDYNFRGTDSRLSSSPLFHVLFFSLFFHFLISLSRVSITNELYDLIYSQILAFQFKNCGRLPLVKGSASAVPGRF